MQLDTQHGPDLTRMDSVQSDIFKEDIVELDRMLTRGEMAGEIAHELNNYLTILLGNVEIIPIFCEKKNCAVTMKKIELMRQTLEKISSMSEKLSDYGKSQRESVFSNINAHIQSLIEFFTPQNRFDGVHVELNFGDDLPPICGDIGKLKQAIGNLIHNAADEVSDSGIDNPTVIISTSLSEDNKHILISVSDNGRGIPHQIRSELFINRVSTKQAGEGYGLLATNKIVKSHSGKVSYEQNETGGTTFTIMLPIANPDDSVIIKS